jgi:hypothetical protein
MSIYIANTSNTSTFQYWLNRTNEMAYQISTSVLTTDASGNTSVTSGNATLVGCFNITNPIGGGSIHLCGPSANQANSNDYFLNANGSWARIGDAANTVFNGNVAFGPNSYVEFCGTYSFGCGNSSVQNVNNTSSTIIWDLSAGDISYLYLNRNSFVANPLNKRVGTYIMHVIQQAPGGYTLTWDTDFKWPAAVAPILTTTPGGRDIMSFVCDGTYMYGTFLPDVR